MALDEAGDDQLAGEVDFLRRLGPEIVLEGGDASVHDADIDRLRRATGHPAAPQYQVQGHPASSRLAPPRRSAIIAVRAAPAK